MLKIDTKDLEVTTNEVVGELRKQIESYEEAVAEAAKEGFTVEFCLHGTYQWTDYDPMCWGCEEGTFTVYSTDEELREVAEPIALERCRSRKFEDLKKSITRMIGEAQDVDALRMYVKIGIDLIDLLEESD